MRLSAALRTPYHPRTLVRPATDARVSDTGLGHAIAWTQAILVALCVARVRADWGQAHPTIEGRISLALLFIVVVWAMIEALRRGSRAAD